MMLPWIAAVAFMVAMCISFLIAFAAHMSTTGEGGDVAAHALLISFAGFIASLIRGISQLFLQGG